MANFYALRDNYNMPLFLPLGARPTDRICTQCWCGTWTGHDSLPLLSRSGSGQSRIRQQKKLLTGKSVIAIYAVDQSGGSIRTKDIADNFPNSSDQENFTPPFIQIRSFYSSDCLW